MRMPAQRAMEGVRVCVGEPGAHETLEDDVTVADLDAVRHLGDEPVLDAQSNSPTHPVGEGRAGAPVGRHFPPPPVRSTSTSASADTPVRQSASSANSAGEWEIPVGLRTYTMAVGMPWLARIPAS